MDDASEELSAEFLRRRVAELEAENRQLRERLATVARQELPTGTRSTGTLTDIVEPESRAPQRPPIRVSDSDRPQVQLVENPIPISDSDSRPVVDHLTPPRSASPPIGVRVGVRRGASSYRDVVLRSGIRTEYVDQAAQALAELHSRPRPPPKTASTAEREQRVRRVYVGNLPWIKVKELKSKLFNLRLLLGQIKHVFYVSRSIVEFSVVDDYARRFADRMTAFGFKVLPDFDPAKPASAEPSDEDIAAAKLKYLDRIQRLAADPACPAKAFFAALSVELQPPPAQGGPVSA